MVLVRAAETQNWDAPLNCCSYDKKELNEQHDHMGEGDLSEQHGCLQRGKKHEKGHEGERENMQPRAPSTAYNVQIKKMRMSESYFKYLHSVLDAMF